MYTSINWIIHLLRFPYWVRIGQYRGSTFCSKLIPHHQLHAIPALGKPWHRVALVDDEKRLSVVLPFFAQFCRQLRIRSSGKLLNAADWTLCFQIKDHIACIPVVYGYLSSKGRNNLKEYFPFFALYKRRLALQAIFWNSVKYLASLSYFAHSILKGSSKGLSTLIMKVGETNTFLRWYKYSM